MSSPPINFCEWEGPWGQCKSALDDPMQRFCILHDTKPGKDPALTTAALRDRLNAAESDPTISMIDFSGVVIPADMSFPTRKFYKPVNFSWATISGDVDFSNCEFRSGAHFRETEFSGEADFSGSTFVGETTFYGASFVKAATFRFADFRVRAYFTNCEFINQADFRYTRFSGGVSFIITTFRSKAEFQGASFHQSSDFQGSVFRQEARFEEVIFGRSEGGELRNPIESEYGSGDVKPIVQPTPFQDATDFTGVQFFGDVSFAKSRIRGALRFGDSSSPSREYSFSFSFSDCALDEANGTRFETINLSNTSFLRTPVSRATFLGCTWAQKEEPLLWPLPLLRPTFLSQRRKAIYDELALDEDRGPENEEDPESELALVADLYRQLRINLEANRQDVEAGDFYVGQMEMRRRDPTYGPIYGSLLGVHRVIALYGQSYWRPLIWYALILAPLFALGYWSLGSDSYENSLFSALTDGALIKGIPAEIDHGERLLVYFNMLADILLLGLTVVALRRHFSR